MIDLNTIALRSYACALRRGKITDTKDPIGMARELSSGLCEEVDEVLWANDGNSEHIDGMPSVVEELTDVVLVCLTEMCRRGVNVEESITAKLSYNESRGKVKTADKTSVYGLLTVYLQEYAEVNSIDSGSIGEHMRMAMDTGRKTIMVIDNGGNIRLGVRYSCESPISPTEIDEDSRVFGDFNRERDMYPRTMAYIDSNRELLCVK